MTQDDKQPTRQTLGRMLYDLTNATAALDDAYDMSMGEETDDTQAAEVMFRQIGAVVLDSFAAYIAGIDGLIDLGDREVKRIQGRILDLRKRRDWASRCVVRLLETQGVKSYQGATREIRTRLSTRVVQPAALDPASLPSDFQRLIPPKPGRVELDKKKAGEVLRRGGPLADKLRALGVALASSRSVSIR